MLFATNAYKKLNILLDDNNEVAVNAKNRQLLNYDGFAFYQTYQNGKYGIEDVNGNEIIPLSRGYTSVFFSKKHELFSEYQFS